MDVLTATRDFEKWMGHHIAAVPDQLSDKHALMAKNQVQFLRGTFYRWAQLFTEFCPDLSHAPRVLTVGDLHIASFGTWRDAFGRLIWGVDDFDEAYPLPYANDLVRLGVSAVLDESEGQISVGLRNVTDVILDGYHTGLSQGGKPFVLEEDHKWLRKIALGCLDEPAGFWRKIGALPTVRNDIPLGARKAITRLLPDPQLKYRIVRRVAGIGSLGHSRYVAVADWRGGQIALEAKAATPSACAWAQAGARSQIYYQQALQNSIRCPDPYVFMAGKWLVHQLSPDSSPIEIETMSGRKDQDKLLHAMASEVANIHLGTPRATRRIISDLRSRPKNWLRVAVRDMAKATIRDWNEWKKARA